MQNKLHCQQRKNHTHPSLKNIKKNYTLKLLMEVLQLKNIFNLKKKITLKWWDICLPMFWTSTSDNILFMFVNYCLHTWWCDLTQD